MTEEARRALREKVKELREQRRHEQQVVNPAPNRTVWYVAVAIAAVLLVLIAIVILV